jgi:hypothetical protein
LANLNFADWNNHDGQTIARHPPGRKGEV